MATRTRFKILDIGFTGSSFTRMTRSSTLCEYSNVVDSSSDLVDGSGNSHTLANAATNVFADSAIHDINKSQIKTLVYNGSSSYYSKAFNTNFNIFDSAHTITVCAEITHKTDVTTLFSFLPSAFNVSGFILYQTANGGIYAKYYKSGTNAQLTGTVSTSGANCIIQITRDSSNQGTMYISGASTSADLTGYGLDNASGDILLGKCSVAGTPYYFNGRILYFRIDTECLSSDELAYERNIIRGIAIGIPSLRNRNNSVKSYSKKGWTFTRASSAMYKTASGIMAYSHTGNQRVNGDALLIEKSSSNAIRNSHTCTGFHEVRPAGDASKSWFFTKCDSDGSFIMCGSSQRLYTSSDHGETWTERRPAGDADKTWVNGAVDSDGSNLIVGDNSGRLWTSSDSGASWTERRPGGVDADYSWRCVASDSDGSFLLAAQYGYRLWTSSDSGASWTERRPAGDVDRNWSSVSCDSDGSHIVVVAASKRIYYSTDSGVTWSEAGSPAGGTDRDWFGTAISSDGAVMLAGLSPGKTVYISTDSGANWGTTSSAPTYTNNSTRPLAVSSDGTKIYAGNDYGDVAVSYDQGANWTLIYPTGGAGVAWNRWNCSADGYTLVAGTYGGGRVYTHSFCSSNVKSISINGTTGVTGSSIADGLVANTTDTTHPYSQFVTLSASAAYTTSVYAKKGAVNWLYLSNNNVTNAYAYFDINSGKVGTVGVGCTAKIIAGTAYGYYRCTISYTTSQAVNEIVVMPANADADNDFAGDGTSVSCWLSGIQTEASKHASSYIPTTTAAVTRASDVMYVPVTSLTSWPVSLPSSNATKLIIELSARLPSISSSTMNGNTALFSISGNTGTAGSGRNRLSGYIGSDGKVYLVFYDNSSTSHTLATTADNLVDFSAFHKYQFTMDFTQFSNATLTIDGSTPGLTNSGAAGASIFNMVDCSLRIGNIYNGSVGEDVEVKDYIFWLDA